MKKAIGLLRGNLLVVAVIVLAMGATAYAGSRIGSNDLKGMRFIGASKTIKPDQRKNIKANCREGEVLLNPGYGITPDLVDDPTPQATVVSFLTVARKAKGRFPDQALLDVANIDNGELSFEADVFGWCLKK